MRAYKGHFSSLSWSKAKGEKNCPFFFFTFYDVQVNVGGLDVVRGALVASRVLGGGRVADDQLRDDAGLLAVGGALLPHVLQGGAGAVRAASRQLRAIAVPEHNLGIRKGLRDEEIKYTNSTVNNTLCPATI